jgi:nitrile hydratase
MGAQNLLLQDSGVVSSERGHCARGQASAGGTQPSRRATGAQPEMPRGPGTSAARRPACLRGRRSVRTRDLDPPGHTRLPRYVRRRAGTVAAVQPAQVFPDSAAHFLGEDPQHVYSVEFASADLWGAGGEQFTLTIDLYEPYLEPVT